MQSIGWGRLVLPELVAHRLVPEQPSMVWPATGSLLKCCQEIGQMIREPLQVHRQLTLMS